MRREIVPEPDEIVLDPVCGDPVDPDAARDLGLVWALPGREEVFCGGPCQRAFAADPDHYSPREREEPPIPRR